MTYESVPEPTGTDLLRKKGSMHQSLSYATEICLTTLIYDYL